MFYYPIMGASQLTTSGFTSIVFVHGLGGHMYRTWSKDEIFWPKDLLGGDVQNIRVITFGYSSSVSGRSWQVSQDQIRDHARALLGDLRRYRKQDEEEV